MLVEHFIAFCNKFKEFNNTGARVLDSIYHMTFKILKNRFLGMKTSIFCHILRSVIMDLITQRKGL